MLSPELKSFIYGKIPTQFTVKGQTLTIPVRFANQWEADVWPAIILEYSDITGNVFTPLNKMRAETNEKQDTFTFVTGTLLYSLSLTKVKEITEVIGIKGGLTHTFVEGTDYRLSSDQIEWLGVDLPDNGTEFDVTFTAKWLRKIVGGEKYDLMSINVYAKDIGKVEEGTFINGSYLADAVAGYLHYYLEFVVDSRVDCLIVAQPDIRNLDHLVSGEHHRRRQFDIHVRHLESYETVIEDIEEVEAEVI